jgi:NAD(P)-dependent dehydrogenase (short-subunit alcohol dehydrogenase family)
MNEIPRAGKTQDPDFTGMVALVTGGGHGIGATIARRLAAAGADVAILGRDETALGETREEILGLGRRCLALRADIASEGDVKKSVADTVAELGSLSVLVNNAGIAGPTEPLETLSLSEWESVMAVNVTGTFLCCREAIPHLRRVGGGRIVNVGSATGKRPLANRSPYAASKMAMVGLTRTLALELGPDEITVNNISPYLVEGPRLDRVLRSMAAERGLPDTELLSELAAASPLGRGVTEDDVAGLALFLASEAAANLTGQDYNVSAGSVYY